MSEELDKRLREAVRPVEPEAGFTDAVMARIGAHDSARGDGVGHDRVWHDGVGSHRVGTHRVQPDRLLPAGLRVRAAAWRWLSGAAAAIVIAGLLVHVQQARHTREGLAARQALMEALQVTAKSLEIAKHALNDSNAPAGAPDPGV